MTSPVIGTPWKKLNAPVSEEAIEGVDKYWRAANYLSIGQIYLRSNPLMKEPFTREDVKHRLVGHWGTTPGLNFLIGHINRLIADHQQNTVIIMGPGHGGPAGTAQSYWTAPTPSTSRTSPRMRLACRSSSASSPTRVASRPTTLRKPRAPSTKAASWVTPCPTPTAL